MAKPKEPFNPFYVLLVALGVTFFLTAFAYGAMAFSAVHSPSPVEPAARHVLWDLLDRHGAKLMAGELVLLALATFAAMGTDRYWINRTERGRRPDSHS